jgi:hypothetical protein
MSSATEVTAGIREDQSVDWLEGDESQEEDYQIESYELVSSPNDFNITTIYNYVWDIKLASKLIESLILGLPVPQIFLYEEARNKFLVIDGQQRLMSIYYFIKGRFSRPEKRSELRRLFAEHGRIDDNVLHDDRYFIKLDLVLPKLPSNRPNKFSGLNYQTLGDAQLSFDLRTIRNVIVKQTSPSDDDSSIHEIFNRLNTGCVNLTPQETRASLYHSKFYDMLARISLDDNWRRLLSVRQPDIHMKDIEVLLRSFAILLDNGDYKSPMVRFLDNFSKKAKSYDENKVSYYEDLFLSFISALSESPADVFRGDSKRFNISLSESVFTAVCEEPVQANGLVKRRVDGDKVAMLAADPEFMEASEVGTTNRSNVVTRLQRARTFFDAPAPGRADPGIK